MVCATVADGELPFVSLPGGTYGFRLLQYYRVRVVDSLRIMFRGGLSPKNGHRPPSRIFCVLPGLIQ